MWSSTFHLPEQNNEFSTLNGWVGDGRLDDSSFIHKG